MNLELFGIEIINTTDFITLVLRFSLNLIIVWIIANFIYYRCTRRKDYLFSYILLSSTIFLICFLLASVKLELGFALGLFAVFGILRYRTDSIPIKEMTYLFIIIGISIINALANKKVSYTELIFTNIIIVAIAFILENFKLKTNIYMKVINYEKIELIKPDRRIELIEDLRQRTGLDILRVELGSIDFLKDSARICIHYRAKTAEDSFTEDRGNF